MAGCSKDQQEREYELPAGCKRIQQSHPGILWQLVPIRHLGVLCGFLPLHQEGFWSLKAEKCIYTTKRALIHSYERGSSWWLRFQKLTVLGSPGGQTWRSTQKTSVHYRHLLLDLPDPPLVAITPP